MDMSLDDIIKNNKKSGSRSSRCRTQPSGSELTRRFPNLAANCAAPYATAKAPEATWQHDSYVDQHVAATGYLTQGFRAASIESGTKLYISNLDYGVSNDDIKVIIISLFFLYFAFVFLFGMTLNFHAEF
ncbi:THO complex subunit 4A [Glycine soja]|uniref:THO complex subunit 4A n=1 Tax=Glycine soja TaxID=3848 RepID=A0A445G8G2_GLYSO|nr:THO complex subunit 4A [Glycine soja]